MNTDRVVLEFDKILLELRRFAVSDLAKELILQIEPTNKKSDVILLLDEVDEACTWIARYDETPMTGVLNVKEALRRSQIGSTLSVEELLRVVSLIEASQKSVTYIKKIKQLEIDTTWLGHYYEEIITHPVLKRNIEECIDDRGNVVDSASVELASIRKKIHIQEKRIEEKMASLLHTEAAKLTDTIITIRNNRLVLPVKSEYKNSFKGIIHDQSASKETVFIEPMSCVEINNNLASLQVDEQVEIDKILAKLSKIVSEYAFELLNNLTLFTTLDIIFAKAKYAIQNDFTRPEITDHDISLLGARHPFIPRDQVVANNITFFDYKTIIITGPNTGGKTVALKTLGLLSIMVQSGMLIPVLKDSKTMVFNHIFADIGDEQSIEQSLSTFSSHITKIIYILHHMTNNSLILLDELGSGTDPKEGASLAMSILNFIRKKSVYSMVTTHYPELKIYAYDLEDTVNASVEFDITTLRPTYRLQIGVPGASNALDIASRLGLQQEIIEYAKHVSLQFDNDTVILMKKLEKQSILLQKEIDDLAIDKANYLLLKQKLEQEIVDHKRSYNDLVRKFEKEKEAELEHALKEVNNLISELDELRKTANFKEHELATLKHQAKNVQSKKKGYQKVNLSTIEVGDIVNVIPYQRNGVVTKQRGEKEFEVQMGVLSSIFNIKDLEFVEKKEKEELKTSVKVASSSSAKVELDLRGMRYEEAIDTFDKYIDDCLINHLEFAYIIHGYGTGALRKGVHDYIKKNKDIKSSRPGGMNEGGNGVTVIYFK
ncbi:MAG: endonuclease MutS2 [Candidatus Izemoplasmatales bacterium]